MEEYFEGINFRLVKQYMDLTNEIERIFESKDDTGEIKIIEYGKTLKYVKNKDKIEITINENKFSIDREPICFFDENNNCLFKIYDSSDTMQINNIFKNIDSYYNCYSSDNIIIPIFDIIPKGLKKITIKNKTESYESKFIPLCNTLSTTENYITINTNCLLPKKSPSLCLNYNSQFHLIINERMALVDKITEFIKRKDKTILKIYGSDGIGKSVTFLYYMGIKVETEINYKIIYFNLRDIFKYKDNIINYFENALMKYYSKNNYYSLNYKESEDINKFNYNIYKSQIEKFKITLNKFNSKTSFWDILDSFCKFTRNEYHSLIIIDQYKSEYDPNNELNSSILNNEKNKNIKFIIASSLNDNQVKEDFIADLKQILKKETQNNVIPKEIIISSEKSIESDLFKDFETDNIIVEDNNKDFKRISIFNEDVSQMEIIQNKEKDDKLLINDYEYDNLNLLNTTNFNSIKNIEIIYINNLVSIKALIKDPEDEKILKLFNFNPKSFVIFQNLLQTNPRVEKEILYDNFFEQRFSEIRDKIDSFYYNLMKKKLSKFSSESLKGTYIIKLKDIISEKKLIKLSELINYLEIFPFKYLKIYLKDIILPTENNIICLGPILNNKIFRLDYSYDFIETAFSKIIDMIPSSTLIDINDLSGSAIGSFVETKIRKFIKKQNYEIRYFWNFVSLSKKNENPNDIKIIYDYDNFKEIKYDDIEEKKFPDLHKYYYIIPGSQTNRSLDSVILQPTVFPNFNMISIQITKNKPRIKSKQEYINDSFIAKSKIESTYGIKIENVYFYFILAEDYPNEETKRNLEIENISYFYFSIRKEQFLKDGNTVELENLNREEAKITQEIDDNENKSFNSKKILVKCIENFLQKKRRSDRQIKKISEKNYNDALKYVFKRTPNIYLNNEKIEKKMKKIVKENNNYYYSGNFTFQFVFTANLNFEDYSSLIKENNLIGLIIVQKKNKSNAYDKSYNFIYMGKIFNDNVTIPNDIYQNLLSNKKPKRLKNKLNDFYNITEIPNEICDRIFVFKIYELIAETEEKKSEKTDKKKDE